MLIHNALYATDLEILQDVLEVLKGPANAAAERQSMVAKAIAVLEAGEFRKAS